MKISKFLLIISVFFLSANVICAQTQQKTLQSAASNSASSSPAFAEVLLRKTELEAEIESLLLSYTEEFPKVQELRFELSVIRKEFDRISRIRPSETAKLTLALGRLIVRKAELETDLWNLRKKYDENHPEAKRAQRKAEIFEAAIKEILG